MVCEGEVDVMVDFVERDADGRLRKSYDMWRP